jgi:ribosomal protein S18 acetylase RimI-like enzyme
MARVREELRPAGITHLGLSVLAANERAIAFYRREGFADAFVEMIGPI